MRHRAKFRRSVPRRQYIELVARNMELVIGLRRVYEAHRELHAQYEAVCAALTGLDRAAGELLEAAIEGRAVVGELRALDQARVQALMCEAVMR